MSVNNGWLLLLVSAWSFVVCSQVAAQEQNAILELTVNQVDKEAIFVILRPQDILITRSDLEKAGLARISHKRKKSFIKSKTKAVYLIHKQQR